MYRPYPKKTFCKTIILESPIEQDVMTSHRQKILEGHDITFKKIIKDVMTFTYIQKKK